MRFWTRSKPPDQRDIEQVKGELTDVQIRVRSLEARVKAMEAAKRLAIQRGEGPGE